MLLKLVRVNQFVMIRIVVIEAIKNSRTFAEFLLAQFSVVIRVVKLHGLACRRAWINFRGLHALRALRATADKHNQHDTDLNTSCTCVTSSIRKRPSRTVIARNRESPDHPSDLPKCL